MPDVACNADDGEPGRFLIAGLHAPAERKRSHRANSGGRRTSLTMATPSDLGVVLQAEFAAGDERNPQGAEVARADDHVPRGGVLPRV